MLYLLKASLLKLRQIIGFLTQTHPQMQTAYSVLRVHYPKQITNYRRKKMTNEQTNLSWLQQEATQLQQNNGKYEKLESLQLKEGTLVTFSIDASKQFEEWRDDNGTIKKIIPVTHKGIRKNFWLNVKNPLYRQIIEKLVIGQSEFTVSTTGTKKETKYSLVVQA